MSKNHRDVSGEKNYFYGKHFCGKEHPMYGKHHTEETKKKMSQSNLNKNGRAVKCLDNNKIFNTAMEAARWCGLSNSSHILECCKGKRKTTKGFRWEFYHAPNDAEN